MFWQKCNFKGDLKIATRFLQLKSLIRILNHAILEHKLRREQRSNNSLEISQTL